MFEEKDRTRARHGSITGAAAVIAVLLVVVSSLLIGASGAMRGSTPPTGLEPAVIPAALADTAIDLNRSQSSGTYVAEYVVLNNSTTLTALPAALTVTASTCKWVTVENLTEAAKPSSSFHNVEYANVTAANGTGTVVTHSDSFKVCGGSGMWINFVATDVQIERFERTDQIGLNMTELACAIDAGYHAEDFFEDLKHRSWDPPGDHSAFAFLDEFHGHVARLGIDSASSPQRPPIVKIDLHRSPHGDPSGNRKALSHDGSPSARLMT